MTTDLQKLVVLMAHKKTAEDQVTKLKEQISEFDSDINEIMQKLTRGKDEPIVFMTKDGKTNVLYNNYSYGPRIEEVEVHKV